MKNGKRKIKRLIDEKLPDLIKKQEGKSKNRTQLSSSEEYIKKELQGMNALVQKLSNSLRILKKKIKKGF